MLPTHDAATIPDFAHQRVGSGLAMSGLIAQATAPVGAIIADLALVAEASEGADWDGRVIFLPVRCWPRSSAPSPS